jgi:glycosyltransferase involved in cell wall biosynthesis
MAAAESIDAPRPEVSVVVCTYNRCASLAETLTALAAQRGADRRWELLVVDNNSHDATASTVASFRRQNPALACRYLFQPQQGLSHARNLGIAEARGELILFTDDDVIVGTDWIATFIDTMQAFGCDACGGYVAPIWERPPPAWLSERFHGFLAIRMDESGPRRLGEQDEPPFGANMGFRRTVFERLGGFDTALGRKGRVLAGGEEWDLFRRVQASGGQVVYTPALRVQHKVEAFRLRKAYFRRWRYDASRGEALRTPTPGRTAFGIPRFLFGQLLRAVLRTLRLHASAPADVAFRQEMIVWHFLGLMTGNRARSKRSPT